VIWPLAGSGEILTHQLVGDAMVREVLELVVEPAYHLRAVHPVPQSHRSTDLLNIMAIR
jgi:hypothetical protein